MVGFYKTIFLVCRYAKTSSADPLCSFFLVPRLCLGIHSYRALPGNYLEFWPIMEAEPPGQAFPGRAWEREVWHDSFSILSFEIDSTCRSIMLRTGRDAGAYQDRGGECRSPAKTIPLSAPCWMPPQILIVHSLRNKF